MANCKCGQFSLCAARPWHEVAPFVMHTVDRCETYKRLEHVYGKEGRVTITIQWQSTIAVETIAGTSTV
jgi:hypothetical protein